MALETEALQFIPLYPDQTEEVIRARWDDWMNEGTEPTDEANWTDVREGSMAYVLTQPGVRESARIYDLMGSEVVAASNPLWAWESYLDDAAAVVGLERKAAEPAAGSVRFTGPQGTPIPLNTIVGVEPLDENDDAPEYETTDARVIDPFLIAPSGLVTSIVAGGALAFSTTYRYVVTAKDVWGGETVVSNEDVETIAGSGTNRSIKLDWNPVVGSVTHYVIYRKTGGGAGPPYNFITQIVAQAVPTYTDVGSGENNTIHPPTENTTGGQIDVPVEARVGGSRSNVGIGAVTYVVSTIPDTSVYNVEPLVGGTDVESDRDLRNRVLERYAAQGFGNVYDYRQWALEEPGVGQVSVLPLWNGPGTVKVVILDSNGAPTSSAVVASLQARLDPVPGQGKGLAPVGAVVTVQTATALAVTITASVDLLDGYSFTDTAGKTNVRPVIVASVERYAEGVQPGSFIVRQKVMAEIVKVAGVNDVTACTLNGVAANLFVDDDPAQVPQVVTLTLTEV